MENTKLLFREFIKNKNLRYTYQRDQIIDELFHQRDHLSSDEFYDLIRKKYPEMGKATVYRTFKLLAEAGITAKVDFGDGVARYELSGGKEHHDHLICEKCRKSVEVVDLRIESLQQDLAKKEGFELTGHKLYLFGICSVCKNK